MNLRTTIRPQLLCSLMLCLWILSTAQRAEADPILPGSGYGETPEAFQALVLHGAVAANDIHVLANAAPGAVLWNFTIVIREHDGGAGMADSVQFILFGQHIVGVPGHVGEGRNEGFHIFNFTIAGPFAPGVNVLPLPLATINHPPIAGHTDQFGGNVIFTVAMDGLNITAYRVEFFGAHCAPQCPSLPPINRSLRQVPEWNALMLFGSGLAGLLGYCRRRMK